MKEALFIFTLSAAGAIVLAYLTAAVLAVFRRTRLDGCGWFIATWIAGSAVWTLLYAAGQISGTNAVPSPW